MSPAETALLTQAGWPRTAARLGEAWETDRPQATTLGLALGDPAIFWKGRPPGLSCTSYWSQAVTSAIPPESRLRLLLGWPPDDRDVGFLAACLLLAPSLPGPETATAFQDGINSLLPPFLRLPAGPAEAFAAASQAWEALAAVVFAPPPAAPPRLRLARLATLQDLGFSWRFTRGLAGIRPADFPQEWAGLAWRARDPASAIEGLADPASSPWSQAFADWLVSMDPADIASLPGGGKLLSLRERGRRVVEALLPPPVTEWQPLPGVPVRQVALFQALGGSPLLPLVPWIPPPGAPEAGASPRLPASLWIVATVTWSCPLSPTPDQTGTTGGESPTPSPHRFAWEVTP